MVVGIAPEDRTAELENFRDQLGITFPILGDPNKVAADQYQLLDREVSSALFPQDWIVDSSGRVAYVNNVYEPDQMQEIIEADLAE